MAKLNREAKMRDKKLRKQARKDQRKADAAVAERKEASFRAEHGRKQETERSGDRNVSEHRDVGDEGAERRNDHLNAAV